MASQLTVEAIAPEGLDAARSPSLGMSAQAGAVLTATFSCWGRGGGPLEGQFCSASGLLGALAWIPGSSSPVVIE